MYKALFIVIKEGTEILLIFRNISNMNPLFRKDAEILDHLNVLHVCDLMVEYSKIYKELVRYV